MIVHTIGMQCGFGHSSGFFSQRVHQVISLISSYSLAEDVLISEIT